VRELKNAYSSSNRSVSHLLRQPRRLRAAARARRPWWRLGEVLVGSGGVGE